MCLAVVALDAHRRYTLVVAANRDEYHARPTAPAAWWDATLLARRDLEAGGTWLGMTRAGRFALLTNVREPHRIDRGAPSRGALVPIGEREELAERAQVEGHARSEWRPERPGIGQACQQST